FARPCDFPTSISVAAATAVAAARAAAVMALLVAAHRVLVVAGDVAAAGAAAAVTAAAAGDLLLDALRHHPAAGDRLSARHAHLHRPGALERDLLGDAAGVGLGAGLRDAPAPSHRAGLGPRLDLASRDAA